VTCFRLFSWQFKNCTQYFCLMLLSCRLCIIIVVIQCSCTMTCLYFLFDDFYWVEVRYFTSVAEALLQWNGGGFLQQLAVGNSHCHIW
jgi:hypothetical protein